MTNDDHKRPQESEAVSDSDSEIRDIRGKRARRESPKGIIGAAETFPAVETEEGGAEKVYEKKERTDEKETEGNYN
jgi:hypothetical protein